jgi:hypothetical protein
MAKRIEEIDVTNLGEVAAIAEEVQRTGEPKRLTKGGQDIALISPVPARKRRKTGTLTESDPLFALVGIGRSNVPGGYSNRKYDALREHHRKKTEKRAFRAQFVNVGCTSIPQPTWPCLTATMLTEWRPC